MHPSLIVIDDFLLEPEALRLRAQAIEGHYAPYRGEDWPEENTLRRVSQCRLSGLPEALERALHAPVEILFSGFRLDYAGELPIRPVHFDAECGDFAAVLYLNLDHQARGGTAFWRHRLHAIDGLPPGSREEIEAWYRSECDYPEAWEIASLIGMRFNRIVVYPTRYFHSRWPREGFGASPGDGRLIGGIFFNTVDSG